MGLIELLSCVGNDNIEFQKLHDCLTSVKEKKRDKCTELSFVTKEITPTEVAMGSGKIGLVVWVDREIMAKAYDEAAELSISSYDANQALITKQAEQINMLRKELKLSTERLDAVWSNLGSMGAKAQADSNREALESTKPVEE